MTKPKGPVLFDLDDGPAPANAGNHRRPETLHTDLPDAPSPADAPPVPDFSGPPPTGQAMTTVATLAARRPSRLARWFWALLTGLIGTLVSISAWNFVVGLVAANQVLGLAVAVLFAGFALVTLMIVVKEVSVFSRLKRIDRLHHAAAQSLADSDLGAARKTVDGIAALYAGREDTRWGRDRLKERQDDIFDAEGLLHLAEDNLLKPLDDQAQREVEAAARQVATVTALVPLALADVFAALTSNIRMIRRIGEIYGGRAGTFGSLRLLRAVMSHLVATGAVAVGDDLLEPFLGGGLLAKVSRRFGEGLVNGALTARVGVAAMEVCRPLPFTRNLRPSVRAIVGRALSGVMSRAKPQD